MVLPMLRAPLLLALLALPSAAEILSPALRVQPTGDNLVLRLEGTADVPRSAADWGPLVDVEYVFVPLIVEKRLERVLGVVKWTVKSEREGTEVSLGFGRARIVSDAVADNPPYLEARPFVVAGQFPGIYRARLVLDPARQSVRLRARPIPAASAAAQARWGVASELPLRARELRRQVEEDAATLQRLGRDLEGLWGRWRAAARAGDEWTAELAEWRARVEVLPSRNDRRPAHAILGWLPAARSAVAEACAALQALADACEQAMAEPAGKRLSSGQVEGAARRAHDALTGLERAAGGREVLADAERTAAALATLRAAPAFLRTWHNSWKNGVPGHSSDEWPAARARFEESLTEALFDLGRASPAGGYAGLAEIARLLLADLPPGPGRNPSLLSAYASRILKETAGPLDEGWLGFCGQQLDLRLGRVEKDLETR